MLAVPGLLRRSPSGTPPAHPGGHGRQESPRPGGELPVHLPAASAPRTRPRGRSLPVDHMAGEAVAPGRNRPGCGGRSRFLRPAGGVALPGVRLALPGGVSGPDLVRLMKKQLEQFSIDVIYSEIYNIKWFENKYDLSCSEGLRKYDYIIVASGTKKRFTLKD